jgi:hypothetical protein
MASRKYCKFPKIEVDPWRMDSVENFIEPVQLVESADTATYVIVGTLSRVNMGTNYPNKCEPTRCSESQCRMNQQARWAFALLILASCCWGQLLEIIYKFREW